ncbi:MAG: hypothetical protein LH628_10775 [Microcoleus sp. CAN_BIN18]|nr:hypothetical protein [Microcoleus sp. CAN_BIN18]
MSGYKKRSIVRTSQPSRELAPTTAAAIPGSPERPPHSHVLSQPRQNREDTQLVKISNSSGVRKLRCPAKQQPNSIDSKPLITYNLKKEEGRRKKEEVQCENLLTVGYGCYNSPSC